MLLRQQERQSDGGASEKSRTNRKGQDSRGKDKGSGNTHKGNDALAPSGRNVSPQRAKKVTASTVSSNKGGKHQLEGIRKVWGTLKSTTTTAVTNALSLVKEVPTDKVSVKRKYKNVDRNGKNMKKWWFVLRAPENVLQTLERHWPKIQIQTMWKIEPVYYSPDVGSRSMVTTVSMSPKVPVVQGQSVAPMSPTEPIVDSPVASQNKSVVQMSPTSSHIEQVEELGLDGDTNLPPLAADPLQEGREGMLQQH